MSTNSKFWKVATPHGLILFAALAGFFLLMRAVGLAHNFYLRSINIVFVFLIINSLINAFHKRAGRNYYDDYFDYLRVAFLTGIVGIGLFGVFIAIYLDVLDPALMDLLRERESMGGLLTPIVASFIVMIEGVVSVMAVAFVLIQLKKSTTVDKPEQDNKSLRKDANPD